MGKDGPGNNRKQWTQLSSSLTALGPQPSFPILLSRVLLVAWAGTRGGRGGPGSGRLEAEFNSSTGWFESFPYIWSTSKEQGKKRSYSDSCPLPLSVLKHVDWMHFHEAESCQQSLQIWRVCPWISAHKMSLVHSGGHALFFSHSTPILITAPRLHYEELPPPHSVWVQLWSDTLGCPVLPQPKLTTQNNLLHLSWASGSPIYMKHIQRGFTQGVAPQKPSSSAVLLVLWVSYSFFFF